MCGSCGNALHIGGPIWHEKIHNIDFVKRLHARIEATKDKYGTSGRIKGILGGIIDEEPLSHKPLSYDFSTVQSQLKMVNMQKKEVIAGFRSLGYLVG
jgi:tRNA G26 N,N-dimethylase Trm1